jgi:hypothetical protein
MLIAKLFRHHENPRMRDSTVRFLRFFAIAAMLASVVVQLLYPDLHLFADLGVSAAVGIVLTTIAKVLHVV